MVPINISYHFKTVFSLSVSWRRVALPVYDFLCFQLVPLQIVGSVPLFFILRVYRWLLNFYINALKNESAGLQTTEIKINLFLGGLWCLSPIPMVTFLCTSRRAAVEETYSKSMSKLAKIASNSSPQG